MAIQASTATFLGIVIMQIGTVLACRTEGESVFKIGIFTNPLVLWGILVEIIISALIIYLPIGNRIYSTHPIPLGTWLTLIPFALLIFLADELRKRMVRTP